MVNFIKFCVMPNSKHSHAPANWSILLVLLVTMCVIEDNSRQVAIGLLASCALLFGGFVLSLHYIYCLFRTAATDNGASAPHGNWRWYALPCAALVIISAMFSHWPMRARFALSESEFRKRALEFRQGDEYETGPERVGLYWVKRIRRLPNGDIGFMTGASLIDPVAITYCPSNPKSIPLNMQIQEDWYAQEW